MACNVTPPRGTGVADAIGNWGFSNNKIASAGCELRRLRQLFNKIDCLRSQKPLMCVKYNAMYDPEAWYIKPSHERYKPMYNIPMKRPLITYSSTAEILISSDIKSFGSDLEYPIPGRSFMQQREDKWYRMCNPNCCLPCPPRCT